MTTPTPKTTLRARLRQQARACFLSLVSADGVAIDPLTEEELVRELETAVRRELARARRPSTCACHGLKPCPLGDKPARETKKQREARAARARRRRE